jgi:hypothetical protein
MIISIIKQVLLAAFVMSLSAQAQSDFSRADTSTVAVSRSDQDAARQKAEDQKKEQELLPEARKLWKEGNLGTTEIQTEAGHYKEALEAYKKAYGICLMKDLEEQMAWLMGEIGDEIEYIKKDGRL